MNLLDMIPLSVKEVREGVNVEEDEKPLFTEFLTGVVVNGFAEVALEATTISWEAFDVAVMIVLIVLLLSETTDVVEEVDSAVDGLQPVEENVLLLGLVLANGKLSWRMLAAGMVERPILPFAADSNSNNQSLNVSQYFIYSILNHRCRLSISANAFFERIRFENFGNCLMPDDKNQVIKVEN